MDGERLEIGINQVTFRELIKAIARLEKTIQPPLSVCGIDIEKYAEKLFCNAQIVTARKNEQIVGLAAFYANDYEKRVGFLSFIAVCEELKGQGIGKKILSEVEKKAVVCGMEKVGLEVFKTNCYAIQFYKKMGYSESDFESENSLYMEKIICDT